MKSFEIGKNDAGQRLDKFLNKSIPLLPQSLLYKSIRKKNIKVNRKRAEISTKLAVGDIVDVYVNDEFFAPVEKKYDFMNASTKIDIIYEDENIMLVDKKVGLLAHPDDREFNDTLITRIKKYLYEKKEYDPELEHSFTPSLVNRIDRNTGGIVIAAKNAQTLRVMNQKMKDRELKKYYLCIVHGILSKKEETLTAFLEKNEDQNRVYIMKKPTENAKKIITKYHVLSENNNMSLLEIDLLTGRTHQIRAHMASIGHPLLGDGKYGTNLLNKATGYKKQMLYSYKISFCFKTDSEHLGYLNNKTFEVKNVWFKEDFNNNKI